MRRWVARLGIRLVVVETWCFPVRWLVQTLLLRFGSGQRGPTLVWPRRLKRGGHTGLLAEICRYYKGL